MRIGPVQLGFMIVLVTCVVVVALITRISETHTGELARWDIAKVRGRRMHPWRVSVRVIRDSNSLCRHEVLVQFTLKHILLETG
jgi:hypothetical protein